MNDSGEIQVDEKAIERLKRAIIINTETLIPT